MAKPVVTFRSAVYATTTGPTYTGTTAWTPAANSLIVAFVTGCAVSPADPSGVTAHGVTLDKLTLPANTISTTHILSVWVGNAGASPTNAAAAATFGGSPTGGSVIEFEVTGWESTEPAVNAFAHIDTATGTGTSGSVTIDLTTDVTSEEVLMAFFVHLANEATTPRTNWTETAGADGNFNSPATGAEAQFRTDAFELTASASWTGNVAWRGVALVVRGTDTTPEDKLKVSDTVTAAITPILATVTENVKGKDGPITFPLEANPQESLKVDDIGQGATQLVGAIKVSDQITASIGASDLAASPQEDLKVSESVSQTLTPLQATPSESVKVSDQLSASLGAEGDLGIALQESVKLDDIGQGQTQLIGAAIRVRDVLTAELAAQGQDLTTGLLTETLKVSEALNLTLDPLQASTTEAIKVSETTTQTLDPLQTSATESVKVSESPSLTLTPLETSKTEAVKVSESATPTLVPLETSRTETVKVTDAVSAALDLLQTSVQEAIKVSDQLTALSDTLAASLSEAVKVSEALSLTLAPLETSLSDAVKVRDLLTVASDLLSATLTESVKVADVLTVATDTLSASLTESVKGNDASDSWAELSTLEYVKVSDSVSAALVGDLVATLQESLKVQDTVAAELSLLLASLQESVKVSDSLSALLGGLSVDLAENVKVSDSASLTLFPEQATPTEAIKVRDTVTAELSVLFVSAQESVKVSDGPAAGAFDLTRHAADESVKTRDTLTVQLGHLEATVSEQVTARDTAQADTQAPSVLFVTLTEGVTVRDAIVITPATPEWRILVQPRTTHVLVQPRVTRILVRV